VSFSIRPMRQLKPMAFRSSVLLAVVAMSIAERIPKTSTGRGMHSTQHTLVADASLAAATVEDLRVALFITTHLSAEHEQFLVECWPSVMSRSWLLQHAEVIFFTSRSPPEGLLQRAFPGKIVRVKHYINSGYEEGAMLAMEMATKGRWFDGYDWVIRVNPDVLILDDDYLIKNMLDNNVAGIFADCTDRANTCDKKCEKSRINTDFFAARGSAVGPAWFTELPKQFDNAENQATAAFQSIVQRGQDRWIKGTEQKNLCRVRGSGVPVLHDHSAVKMCPLAPHMPRDRG